VQAGFSALMIATMNCDKEIVSIITKKEGVDLNAQDQVSSYDIVAFTF
jgi:hypothetical protein